MGPWEGFAWGLFGGFLAEMIGWFELRRHVGKDLPAWMGTLFYWLCTAFMMISAGVLVVGYLRSGISVSPIIAINVGASAPLLIRTFVAQTPAIPPSDRID